MNSYATVSLTGCGVIPGTTYNRIPEDSQGLIVNLYGSKAGPEFGTLINPGQTVWTNGYTQTVKWVPIRQQSYPFTKNPNEGSANNEELCFPVDGSEVCADVAPTFAFKRATVGKFFSTYGMITPEEFTAGQFKNGLRNCLVKEASALSRSKEAANAGTNMLIEIRRNPVELLDKTTECLRVRFPFVDMTAVELLGKPRLSNKALESAIEDQLEEAQQALKAQATEAKEKALANSKIAKARGDADSSRILAETPGYIALRKLDIEEAKWTEKWDGRLPTTNVQTPNAQVVSPAANAN